MPNERDIGSSRLPPGTTQSDIDREFARTENEGMLIEIRLLLDQLLSTIEDIDPDHIDSTISVQLDKLHDVGFTTDNLIKKHLL
jgi:hypothetical protein